MCCVLRMWLGEGWTSRGSSTSSTTTCQAKSIDTATESEERVRLLSLLSLSLVYRFLSYRFLFSVLQCICNQSNTVIFTVLLYYDGCWYCICCVSSLFPLLVLCTYICVLCVVCVGRAGLDGIASTFLTEGDEGVFYDLNNVRYYTIMYITH